MLKGGNAFVPATTESPHTAEIEALMEEARQRQRKRRRRTALVLGCLLGAAALCSALFDVSAFNGFLRGGGDSGAAGAFGKPALVGLVYAQGVGPINTFCGCPTGPDWVWLAQADGSHAVALTPGSNPSISPDGRWIVYYRPQLHGRVFTGWTAFVIPSQGGRPRPLLAGAPKTTQPSDLQWAPDSRHLLRIRQVDFNHAELDVLDRVAGSVKTVSRNPCHRGTSAIPSSGSVRNLRPVITASFSPSGRSIVFGCGGELYIYNLSAQTVRPLVHAAGSTVWGPSWIAFSRTDGRAPRVDPAAGDIWLVRANGTGAHELTSAAGEGRIAALSPFGWSGDGAKLIATRDMSDDDSPDADVWIVDARTGAAHPLPQGFFFPTGLSRDGNLILGTSCDFSVGVVKTLLVTGGAPRSLLTGPCGANWNA